MASAQFSSMVTPRRTPRFSGLAPPPRGRPLAAELKPFGDLRSLVEGLNRVVMRTAATGLAVLGALERGGAEPTYTSKFYVPGSLDWSGRLAALKIPSDVINNSGSGKLHQLCQTAPRLSEFHYLRVPGDFLRRNLSKFAPRDNGRVSSFSWLN